MSDPELQPRYESMVRILRPLDSGLLTDSASRKRALSMVEEGPPVGGYAAEVISLVCEQTDDVVARPMMMPSLPRPFSRVLEDAAVPRPADVVEAVRDVAGRVRSFIP